MTGAPGRPPAGPPRCWRCQLVQPFVAAPYRNELCVYCGTDLTRPPVRGRTRWLAHRPVGAPPPKAELTRLPYAGPPRYRYLPRWGFPASIWVTPRAERPPAPASPIKELRSVNILASAAGAMCVFAALFEGWRYVLSVRGRTEVLYANEVRVNDALVVAAGWGALLLAVGTALTLLPALARTEAYGTYRARVRSGRRPAQRLMLLLIPGWNLYGAGVVLAEIDALLRLPDARPEASDTVPPARAPMRWRSAELPVVAAPVPPTTTAPASSAPVFRSPHRLITWWWVFWALNGLLAVVVAVRMIVPGSLQVRADLVWWHVVVQLVGAVVAFLTAAVARRWVRVLQPPTERWPAGWTLQRGPSGAATGTEHGQPQDEPDQPTGSGASPIPITEPVNS